jgi:tetratricopeptide (TPR) repeat protein
MVRRDYILRMIEQLAQLLARTRGQIAGRKFDEADTELDKAFLELTGAGAEAIAKLSETELLAKLTLDAPTIVVREKTLVLTALLQEAGQLRIAQGREEEGEACWLKALNLLLTLKFQDPDNEFPEFVPKIDLLRDQLREAALPLQTLAALWRYYEGIGAYARAEDSLASLLEDEPNNAALQTEARAFYERLLRQSDSALESGNLPRAEVQAGLTELRG